MFVIQLNIQGESSKVITHKTKMKKERTPLLWHTQRKKRMR